MKCGRCGRGVSERAKYCRCGHRVDGVVQSSTAVPLKTADDKEVDERLISVLSGLAIVVFLVIKLDVLSMSGGELFGFLLGGFVVVVVVMFVFRLLKLILVGSWK
jgi:hypothetical protein